MVVRRSMQLGVSALALTFLTVMACSGGDRRAPLAPSPTAASDSLPAQIAADSRLGTADVDFPPRDQPFSFRQQLEAKYRDQLRRSATQSFVDIEGDIVWIQEYLRYRVNACAHADAVDRVFRQIDTGVIAPVCGSAPSGTVTFPPRDQPFAFRQQLEAKYRDQLRRGASQTFVDIEGDIVWIQEYLRYRVNGCNHSDATTRVFQQIDTGVIAPVCAGSPPDGGGGCVVDAKIDGPSGAANTNRDLTFSGLRSTTTCPPIRTYQWNCGLSTVTGCNSTSATPTWRYPKTGALGTTVTYTITLTVEDTRGGRNTDTYPLTITQVY